MRLIITILVGVISASFASSASAQVINACVNDATGFVRIVSDPNDCRPPDSPVSWNVQGPAGPMGATGPMGEPGKALDVGTVVQIELPATSGFDTIWIVPAGKALLVDHIIWNDKWKSSSDPMEVTIRHIASGAGSPFESLLNSTTGFRSFDRPLILPANSGFDAPDLNDPDPFPKAVFIYGRLVDADSAQLSGTD